MAHPMGELKRDALRVDFDRRLKLGTHPGWTDQLLARRPTNVVLVAMANKTARVAWALLRYERIYQPTPA